MMLHGIAPSNWPKLSSKIIPFPNQSISLETKNAYLLCQTSTKLPLSTVPPKISWLWLTAMMNFWEWMCSRYSIPCTQSKVSRFCILISSIVIVADIRCVSAGPAATIPKRKSLVFTDSNQLACFHLDHLEWALSWRYPLPICKTMRECFSSLPMTRPSALRFWSFPVAAMPTSRNTTILEMQA